MRRGQSTIEYALLIAIVAAAFTAMHLYMQRAVQANFKLIEDQVNVEPLKQSPIKEQAPPAPTPPVP